MTVRLTVMIVSKKTLSKYAEAWPMMLRRRVGKKTVKRTFINLLPRKSCTLKPFWPPIT